MDVFHTFFFLILNFAQFSMLKGENGCRDLDFLRCYVNKTLKDHVIRLLRVSSPAKPNCQHECFKDVRCTSYNLRKQRDKGRTCELNDADHLSDHGDLLPSEGAEYCPIKNPCASKPCRAAGKVCLPDFAWNTYQCKDGKWSKWSAWECRCFNRTRSRECKNPLTNQTAADCIGAKIQSEKCQHQIACVLPLGMEDGRIQDSQISASSYYKGVPPDECLPSKGRLNQRYAQAWCAAVFAAGQYLQVDLGSVRKVFKIATQGRDTSYNQYVKKYKLQYTNDTVDDWHHYPVS
ncbi:EGF-like repeat and discoidin I-like domain-containing protein 3 [Exaiptasia diaphana]|uniref:F5/8 type C domain-containing protein n=1 Tax=Exaiptasia diaphana TaxID=2652724 RepID=A0A913WYA9_EXADI|nr:EGF-like repeat and discoidin I-like domain-containing protein 3 [Exaiptasia diaphana]